MAGTYANYDFSETVNHYDSPIKQEQIEEVLYATGEDGSWGEWSGGFVLRLKDGRIVIVTGWCDSSGWGCQDGMTLAEVGDNIAEAVGQLDAYGIPTDLNEWDEAPTDLNRYLRGEIDRWA